MSVSSLSTSSWPGLTRPSTPDRPCADGKVTPGHDGVTGAGADGSHEGGAAWHSMQGPVVTLTFDDGPFPALTLQVLPILAKHKIKAAFFFLGKRIARDGGAEIMQRVFDAGHQIGNHTFSHPDLTRLTGAAIRQELETTQALIGDYASPRKYFRPPFRAINEHVEAVVARLGYTMTLWNVDTRDWETRSPAWIDAGLGQIRAKGRSIVLNHDKHATTVDNLDRFIVAIYERFPDVQFAPLA